MMGTSWSSPVYQHTVLIVLSIIFGSGLIVYLFRKSNYYFIASWASIKSWLIVAPLLFILMGLPSPLPLMVLVLIAILGAKAYFQIMGMYNRSYFVLLCYAGILALGACAYFNRVDIYNVMPMAVLGAACLIPMARNNYKHMIQYMSLTLLGFIFLGWSFMHLGLILHLENGIYQLIYLIILTEFCDNTNLAVGRYFGKIKIFPKLNQRRTLGGLSVSIILTLVLAGVMRSLLPDRSDKYWLTAGLIASLGGFIGDLVMSVIRKDAGVKIVGPFIIGRGDFLHRMDRLIFVAPIYFYIMLALPDISL
ncbi:MAG TPA: phosphatidate cytidylyltransferase [Pseudobdellovibrionaceae bacterium]|jgi:phosphatidate cytidylyltransferase